MKIPMGLPVGLHIAFPMGINMGYHSTSHGRPYTMGLPMGYATGHNFLFGILTGSPMVNPTASPAKCQWFHVGPHGKWGVSSGIPWEVHYPLRKEVPCDVHCTPWEGGTMENTTRCMPWELPWEVTWYPMVCTIHLMGSSTGSTLGQWEISSEVPWDLMGSTMYPMGSIPLHPAPNGIPWDPMGRLMKLPIVYRIP